MSPEQLLGELDDQAEVIVSDLEAGVGTLARLKEGDADVVLVVCEPTLRSIEVARRAADLATRQARVIVVANKVADEAGLAAIERALPGRDIHPVPEDEAVVAADKRGASPLDGAAASPAVRALLALAERL